MLLRVQLVLTSVLVKVAIGVANLVAMATITWNSILSVILRLTIGNVLIETSTEVLKH